MEKVFLITRKINGRKPTDDLKDLDVNTAFWCIFMSVTLQTEAHLGQDSLQKLRKESTFEACEAIIFGQLKS